MDFIVTGGRNYTDGVRVNEVLRLFDIGLLIQGGANGADRLARIYGHNNPIFEIVTIEADWNKYGKAAGPIRNREMLDKYPNAIVVAFPGGKGTEDCVKAALERNMVVLRVEQ